MKITPDIPIIRQRPDASALDAAQVSPSAAPKPRTKELTYGEALSLTQVSNLVVQKALTISMQLKSMAARAMSTGSFDDAEMSRVLAEIGVTLGKFGEQITAPDGRAANAPRRGDYEAARDLARTADLLSRGRIPGDGSPAALVPSLRGRAIAPQDPAPPAEIDAAAASGAAQAPRRAAALATETMTLIAEAPRDAVAAQGNINREHAARLIR